MIHSRSRATATFITHKNKVKWWITGGDGSGRHTTELYHPESGFELFVDLPKAASWHNLVHINDTHVLMLCGISSTKDTYVFDMNSQSWSSGPQLTTGRYKCQAGTFLDENGYY